MYIYVKCEIQENSEIHPKEHCFYTQKNACSRSFVCFSSLSRSGDPDRLEPIYDGLHRDLHNTPKHRL